MRLKLDENLPRNLADDLTRRGHDLDTVLDEQLGGRKDQVVVRAATDDDRMLLTLDRGIGASAPTRPAPTLASSCSDLPVRTQPRSSGSLTVCSTPTTSRCSPTA